MKKLLSASWTGVKLACTIFIISSLFMTMGGADASAVFASKAGMFRIAVACILTGIAFGAPSFIYETELPMAVKILVHMGIGCAVMLVCQWWANPDMRNLKPWMILVIFLGQITIAFAIWLVQYLKSKKLAKAMNARMNSAE